MAEKNGHTLYIHTFKFHYITFTSVLLHFSCHFILHYRFFLLPLIGFLLFILERCSHHLFALYFLSCIAVMHKKQVKLYVDVLK